MPKATTNVAILGSTGSIGRSTLEVVAASQATLRVVALSAHRDFDRLIEQARQVRPLWVVASDAEAAARHSWTGLPDGCELIVGPAGLEQVVRQADIDV